MHDDTFATLEPSPPTSSTRVQYQSKATRRPVGCAPAGISGGSLTQHKDAAKEDSRQ